LTGGRVTAGVVRVGETLRRPRQPNSAFVRALLAHLEGQGFDAAPCYLGADEHGREIFTFQLGEVLADLDPALPDETLARAARLIRRYHDATAGSPLAGEQDVVCHHDLSPCNFVFRDGKPVGLIDFDVAAPGTRLQDIGYAIFLWLNLGTDGPAAGEQARRIRVFCEAYGIEADDQVIDAVVAAVASKLEQLEEAGRLIDAEWWQAQRAWVAGNRTVLTASVRGAGHLR
jgi:Ser/Thr protein kinase RdoA (MazF antagonist)